MFSPVFLVAAICVYMAVLYGLAKWAEGTERGRAISGHPIVYALGLAVYCTTWTYYGSVGKASKGGMGFITIYLGPTLLLLVGASLVRKMIRIKKAHHITSIADFISARYGKSQGVAALVTVILMIGIVPYVGLQLKAVSGTVHLMTAAPDGTASSFAGIFNPIMVVLMVAFTIMFGIRHLDPTERHPGMVFSVAAESMVKLTAFLAAGAFVVGSAFGGLGGFVDHINEAAAEMPFFGAGDATQSLTWFTLLILSTCAFGLLPRQFHVAVIEADDDRHMKTARWLTPLYLIVINLLVVPIAMGGALIAKSGTGGDQYVLALPLQAGNGGLSLAVFIGGFSAAIGMIMISAMTMSTMISNHLLMPVIQKFASLRFLQRHLLYLRWGAAAAFISAGYGFEVGVGGSYMLVAIGLISFAAAFILAPVVLAGMYWRAASRKAALMALGGGFAMWLWTLLIPTFIKSGWLPKSILTEGPWGAEFLRPEAFFGLAGLPSLTHGVLWCGAVTGSLLVAGTALFPATKEEQQITEEFLDVDLKKDEIDDAEKTTSVRERYDLAVKILSRFLSDAESAATAQRALNALKLDVDGMMSVMEEAELRRSIEHSLAGAIGSATAHASMKTWEVSQTDSKVLMRQYAKMMARLKMSPKQIKERINFQAERENLLGEQFKELQLKIDERDAEIVERQRAEEALQEAHDKLEDRVQERTAALAARNEDMRLVLNNVAQGFFTFDTEGKMSVEKSAIVERWLGHAREGETVGEYLGRTDENQGSMLELGIESLRDGFLPVDVLLYQFPKRFQAGERTLSAEYKPVLEGGEVSQILFVLSDITEELKKEHAERSQREMMQIFEQVMRDKSGFIEFFEESGRLLDDLAKNLGQDLAVTKRNIHTLKGNCAVYGVSTVAFLCNELEEAMSESDRAPRADEIAAITARWGEVRKQVDTLVRERNLGTLELTSDDVGALSEAIARGASHEELKAILASWELEPTEKRLLRLAAQAERLASQLGKGDVEIRVEHNDLRLDPESWTSFWSSMIHVLRNAIDHGLEDPEERKDKGKSRGEVTLRTLREDDRFIIEVADNGRGVDWERVAEKGRARGKRAETQEELAMLLFESGLSTRDVANSMSGRGVGLSAVLDECDVRQGNVVVNSHADRGTSVRFEFPIAAMQKKTAA